ncbi:ABC transporter permease subunit [Bacillus sp. BRMEA1]|uniref:ABC transporter permease subunit n=1 Tax=Neobacillus endophyticus TaxID=2738405 RepID=UPI0015663CD4|nr:ABC transporter permease subunit [Neobacillus endophyticus]NRD77269.1 ABC transporter permease subunit [Neobacillus endophyticus]
MNLFWREIKANRKALIIWCLGILFMVVSGMAKYSAYQSTGQSINELIGQMPKSLQAILGMDSLNLSTSTGFYGMLFIYLLMMAAIHALMLGANIIAKEEQDHTAEFLMAKPISRMQIVTAKLLAGLVNIVIFNLVTLILSLAMVNHYMKHGESLNDVYLLLAGMLMVQLMFLGLGTGIAAAGKRPKRAGALGTAILLVMYMLSIAIDLNKNITLLKYLTPFKYFEAKKVLADGSLDAVNVGLSLVVIAVLVIVTYVSYQKRDLRV